MNTSPGTSIYIKVLADSDLLKQIWLILKVY